MAGLKDKIIHQGKSESNFKPLRKSSCYEINLRLTIFVPIYDRHWPTLDDFVPQGDLT